MILNFILGDRVPNTMSDRDWLRLLNSKRKENFWNYLFKTEKKMQANARKKLIAREKHEEHIKKIMELKEKGLYETPNRIFYRIRPKTMNTFYENNLWYALQNGPSVVVDLGFEDIMVGEQSRSSLGKQIQEMHYHNRHHKEPVHLHFCNLSRSSKLYELLSSKSHGDIVGRPYYSFDEKDCVDLYPKENLVYLTPNATHILKEYNENDVYIIGGLVDSGKSMPLTRAKARKQNLRAARLPLDYVR